MKNTKLTSVDFETIKSDIQNKFKDDTVFKDYNFEGSTLSILLDVLAYNTQFNAIIANTNVKESILSTSTILSNIESRVQDFGYLPVSKRCSVVTVTISSNTHRFITPNDVFSVDVGGTKYYLVPKYYVSLKEDSGKYVGEVDLYFGELHKTTSLSNTRIGNIFSIIDNDVDTTTIKVSYGTPETTLKYVSNISEVDSKSNTYLLEKGRDGKYRIIFGDGVYGADVSSEDINITYVTSYGTVTNNIPVGTKVSSGDVEFTFKTSSSGGGDGDTSETIKRNYKSLFNSQNRAVTASDFKSIIKSLYPNDKVTVFGGEDLDPPVLNSVFVSIYSGSGGITKIAQDSIRQSLKDYSFMNTQIDFIDPDLLYIGFDNKVTIDFTKTDKSKSDINDIVKNSIITHFKDVVNDFGVPFSNSRLGYNIFTNNSFINSYDSIIKIYKKVHIGDKTDFKINYSNVITKGTVRSSKISLFIDGIEQEGYVVDNQSGVLNFVNGPTTLKTNVGSIDYKTGLLTFNDNGKIIGDYIYFYANIPNGDVSVSNNGLLTFNDQLVSNSTKRIEEVLTTEIKVY